MGLTFSRDKKRNYELIEWEHLISISEASKKYGKNNKTLNTNIAQGIFVEGIDCIKIGTTWVLDDRRLQDIYINNIYNINKNTFPPEPFPRDDRKRNYKLIEWEYLISLIEASVKYKKHKKTLNKNILNGIFMEGIDCAKIGTTWALDDRRLQEIYSNKN